MAEFEAAGVKNRALEALIRNSSDPEESRQIFLEEIMDWSDYFSEQFGESSSMLQKDSEETPASKIFESIVDLWLEFASFEISLRQFKKAVDVYEKAVSDPVVSSALRIHLSYADFCVERGKLANARKVYLKAIQLPFSNADRSNLWNRFLILMHKINKSDELTIEQLFLAVKQQLTATAAAESACDVLTLVPPPSVTCADTNSVHAAAPILSPPVVNKLSSASSTDGNNGGNVSLDAEVSVEGNGHGNVSYAESKESIAEPADSSTEPLRMGEEAQMEVADPNMKIHGGEELSTAAASVGDDLDSLIGLTPEMVVKMYNRRPPMIFTATNREPLISGLRCLDSKLTSELEDFIGCPLSSVVSSVGGDRDAANIGSNSVTVDACLDLLESMWATQALKERHFDSWMAELHQMHSKEEAEIQRNFENDRKQKESISNDAEYKRFVSRCSVQRELLNCIINKAMFALLMEQQVVLAQIGFPRFSLQFVEALYRFIDSRKVGVGAGTLKQHTPQFEYEFTAGILDQIAAQRKLVCGFLSLRMFAVNEDRSKLQAAANRMRISSRAGGKHELYSSDSKQQRQYPAASRKVSDSVQPGASHSNSSIPPLACGDAMVLDDDGNNLSPVSPASSDTGGFDSDPQSADCIDYYSLEAKKRRRKRRLNVQHFPNSGSEGSADHDNGGWAERNLRSNYNSRSAGLPGSTQSGSVYANRYNDGSNGGVRSSGSWGNSYNGGSNSSSGGWNENQSLVQGGQFSRYDQRSYQDFGGPSIQNPQDDALKLPLLHKLAVMLKQQTGGQGAQQYQN